MKKETAIDDAFEFPELSKMSDQEFYCTYKHFMYSVAVKESLDEGQAGLAINDVLINIFMKHACYFDPKKGRFSNYLATMVRNACRSLRRKERRYIGVEEEELVCICEKNGSVSRGSGYEPGEITGWVEEGIRILRKQVRSQLMVDAFVMQVIEEKSPKEIAQKLKVRPDYVSVATNRCLPRLRTIVRGLMAK